MSSSHLPHTAGWELPCIIPCSRPLAGIGFIYDMRARERSTASGNTPKRPLRASAVGHTWGLLLHGATAGWAAASGDWQVPLALVAIGVLVHLYPILIQLYVLTAGRNP